MTTTATGGDAAPRVSVCIPAFNAAPWIEETITSVLDQTFGDFELRIIDDASQDATARIIETLREPRITFTCHAENRGVESTWNRLLAEAQGDYVKVLCSDDRLARDALARQAAVLDDPRHAEVGIVCGPRDIIDRRGRVLLERRGSRRRGVVPGRVLLADVITRGCNLVGEPLCVLFRRQLAARVGPFDASLPYCIDIDMWCRLLAVSDAYVLDRSVGAFRVSPTAWSTRLAAQQARQDRAFLDRARRRLLPGLPAWRLRLGQVRCTARGVLRNVLYGLLRWQG